MSSTNKTANLKMHSWVRTDPVVCDDFNENFNKIDAAIGDMRASYGGCEIYTGEYMGTGEGVYSLTFPKLPVLLLADREGAGSYYSGFIRDGATFIGMSATQIATLSISGTTVTFTQKRADDIVINREGYKYYYIAFAPAKK